MSCCRLLCSLLRELVERDALGRLAARLLGLDEIAIDVAELRFERILGSQIRRHLRYLARRAQQRLGRDWPLPSDRRMDPSATLDPAALSPGGAGIGRGVDILGVNISDGDSTKSGPMVVGSVSDRPGASACFVGAVGPAVTTGARPSGLRTDVGRRSLASSRSSRNRGGGDSGPRARTLVARLSNSGLGGGSGVVGAGGANGGRGGLPSRTLRGAA